jgi:hypothetical protein
MMSRRTVATTVALAALVAACASTAPVFRPRVWDRHGDAGPLAVYGASRSEAGPQIFRALREEPALSDLLAREGEPDTVEVVGGRYSSKRIVLTYTRRSAGPPRRITIDSTRQGLVARAPEPLPTERQRPAAAKTPARRRQPARPKATRTPQGAPTPSERQRLECAIEPARPDCQALCRNGAPHDWCR